MKKYITLLFFAAVLCAISCASTHNPDQEEVAIVVNNYIKSISTKDYELYRSTLYGILAQSVPASSKEGFDEMLTGERFKNHLEYLRYAKIKIIKLGNEDAAVILESPNQHLRSNLYPILLQEVDNKWYIIEFPSEIDSKWGNDIIRDAIHKSK